MNAVFQKITISPVKLDAEGDIKKLEGARIVLDIPLDSATQKAEVLNILDLLSDEQIILSITARQLKLDLAASG